MGTFWAGPFLGCYLGAFGANVIKVESTSRPDGFRFVGAFPEEGADWYERSGLFQATNLNKRGVTIDLRLREGRELFARLLVGADVLIENYSIRVVEQFGFDYEGVRAIEPEIIMVRMPGYGLDGPWRDFVGFGNTFEHAGGLSAATGYPDGPPQGPGGYSDPISAIHAAVALQAALEYRSRTGHGQLIEVAQIEVMAAIAAEQVVNFTATGEVPNRMGNTSPVYVPQGVYQCRDEKWLAISVVDDRSWAMLCRTLSHQDWSEDKNLATTVGRTERRAELDAGLRDISRTWAARELAEALLSAGVAASVVLTPEEMYSDPHLNAVGYYETLRHPISGERRYPGWPMMYSCVPGSHHRFASPTLGQHNEEILKGELGLSDLELAHLREIGVIGNHTN